MQRTTTPELNRWGGSLLLAAGLALAASSPLYAYELVFEAASETAYAQPHDIVLSPDQRYLYLADNGNDRIAVLDPGSLRLLGSAGEGELVEPHDVAFDADGRLLVADTGGSRIAIFQVDGSKARLVGELKARISRPEGVAVHPNGRVYATGSGSNNVVVYQDGAVVGELGGFSGPHDIVTAPDGSLWIADSGNDRLVNVDEDLQIVRVVGGKPYNFKGPRYFDFDSAGRLYVADKYNNRIVVLAPDLQVLATIGDQKPANGKVFDRPEGIAIHGQLAWFVDTYNDRIVRYRIVD
jgi:DNA-binding beta-propeller fold protein YncE